MIFVNDLISLLDLATTMENVIPMSIRGPLLKFERSKGLRIPGKTMEDRIHPPARESIV